MGVTTATVVTVGVVGAGLGLAVFSVPALIGFGAAGVKAGSIAAATHAQWTQTL